MANARFTQVSCGLPKVLLCNQLLPQTSHLLFRTSPLRQKTSKLSCHVRGWGLLPKYSSKTNAKLRVYSVLLDFTDNSNMIIPALLSGMMAAKSIKRMRIEPNSCTSSSPRHLQRPFPKCAVRGLMVSLHL
jgi:hypothetical protein